MPSRSDELLAALTPAVDDVVAAVRDAARAAPVILIDGGSGAGKSTFTALLAERLPQAEPIALDWIYPGWDGLAAGAHAALTGILQPHREGREGRWNRWDWVLDRPAEEHLVDPARGVIIEGCGALTPASAALADVCVWLESPEPSRRRRALERDGDAYRPHWELWARQERRHWARHNPSGLADIVVAVP